VQAYGGTGAACRGWNRGRTQVWLEVGGEPDRRSPLGGEGVRERRGGGSGLSCWVGKRRRRRPIGLGLAGGWKGEGKG
jgi:hypothetical protein